MNRVADLVLMYENRIEEAMEQARDDMPKTAGSPASPISDPTAQKAIRNITPLASVYVDLGQRKAGKCSVYCLRYPDKWISAIRRTWDYYKGHPTQYRLMELRYKKGTVDISSIALDLDVSVQRTYVMLDDIHRFLLGYAQGLGASIVSQAHAERVADILKTLKEKR